MTLDDLTNNIVANARAINKTVDETHGSAQVNRQYTPNSGDSRRGSRNTMNETTDFNDGMEEKEGLFEAALAAAGSGGMTANVTTPIPQMPQYASTGKNHTKIPSFIKEEMEKNPSDQSVFDPNPLNRIKLNPVETPVQKTQTTVSENKVSTMSTSIDYGFIRDIVNQCLENKLSEMKGGLLTESASLNTIGLKNGVIKLVDNKGNIFKAKLERVGNVNDK